MKIELHSHLLYLGSLNITNILNSYVYFSQSIDNIFNSENIVAKT